MQHPAHPPAHTEFERRLVTRLFERNGKGARTCTVTKAESMGCARELAAEVQMSDCMTMTDRWCCTLQKRLVRSRKLHAEASALDKVESSEPDRGGSASPLMSRDLVESHAISRRGSECTELSCASCTSAATVRCDGADAVDSAASDGELEWAGTCSSKSPASCTSMEQTLLPPSVSPVARAAHEVAGKMGGNEQALSDLQAFLTPTRVTLSERHLKIFSQEVELKWAGALATGSWYCEGRVDVNDREQTSFCF